MRKRSPRARVVIALDVHGTDTRPGPELAAAAALHDDHIELVLVGARDVVAQARWRSMVATQTVEMADDPIRAHRSKPDSSLRVALEALSRGEIDAVVSAGHSGAVVASAVLALGMLPGVARPSVISVLPSLAGHVVLSDAGAMTQPSPHNVMQSAVLAANYARRVLGVASPRIGLLSNGCEAHKGTPLTREAAELIAATLEVSPHSQWLGYIEGNQIFGGSVDVVVTDGFTGNVLLKTCEGIAEGVMGILHREMAMHWCSRLGAWLARGAFARSRAALDYTTVGGALLAGVAGPVILAHGRSDASALVNAIRTAAALVAKGVVSQALTEGLAPSPRQDIVQP